MNATGDTGSFGALLKTLRRRQRLTQQQLALAIGVRGRTLVRWEQGDTLPESKTMVLELARCLNLDDLGARQLLEASLTALSPYWSVPLPRNPYFTGREEILEALHEHLRVEQAVTLVQSSALHGLGGIGKTQIALEYAYRHALSYSAVFWIEAETEEQIVSGFLRIAQTLQLSESKDKEQQQVIAAVGRWLSTHRQWLVLWDNVENLDLLQRYLPTARSGANLLTTRSTVLGTLAEGLNLSPMKREEATLFLLRRAKLLPMQAGREQMAHFAAHHPSELASAEELTRIMDGLPLALDQAGAYLEATQCGLPAYLELFGNRRAALLASRGEGVREHPLPVSATFSLAITEAEKRHAAVRDLLWVCALLSPDTIPEELFREAGEHLGPCLQATVCDDLAWNQVVALTCGYSLLARQAEQRTLSVHRLVQAVVLDAMQEEECTQWSRRAITALDAVFPELLLAPTSAMLRQGERLLPHALWCLQRNAGTEIALATASLACKTAGYLFQCGRYADLEPLYQRALRLREQVLGTSHPLVAQVVHGLGRLSHEQGQFEQAESLYQQAISIQEHAGGSDPSPLAHSLLDLATLYHTQGRYALAEPLYQRTLAIYDHAFGPDHPNRAYPLNGLAGLCYFQGQYEQAASLFHQALCIWEQALGSDHPQVALALYNLAGICYQQDEYEQAQPLLHRSLSILEQAYGPTHPRLAPPLGGLAELYRKQGKSEQAEPLYQRVLSIQEQAYGPTHPRLAYPLEGLAELYREQGKSEQAEPLYQRALCIQERELEPTHPDLAETLHHLALLRKAQGNLSEAISLASRALTIRTQSLGDTHAKTVAIQALYTQLVQEQERVRKGGAHAVQQTEALVDGSEEGSVLVQDVVSAQSTCEHDPLQEFLETRCELHPHAWCRVSDLWRAYEQWVTEHQKRFPLSRRAFAARVKMQGCSPDRTNEARLWRGIALRSPHS